MIGTREVILVRLNSVGARLGWKSVRMAEVDALCRRNGERRALLAVSRAERLVALGLNPRGFDERSLAPLEQAVVTIVAGAVTLADSLPIPGESIRPLAEQMQTPRRREWGKRPRGPRG